MVCSHHIAGHRLRTIDGQPNTTARERLVPHKHRGEVNVDIPPYAARYRGRVPRNQREPIMNETALRPREAEKRSMLQNHCVFGKLSPKHIDRLVACIVRKSIPRGTNIFTKGDPGLSLFAIRKGRVKITVP